MFISLDTAYDLVGGYFTSLDDLENRFQANDIVINDEEKVVKTESLREIIHEELSIIKKLYSYGDISGKTYKIDKTILTEALNYLNYR